MGSGVLIIYGALLVFLLLGLQLFFALTKGRVLPLVVVIVTLIYPIFIILGFIVFVGHLCMTALERTWYIIERELKKL